ncbi:MAG: hypothetical protein U0R19_10695 [Bryobacteraceae bacterium]
MLFPGSRITREGLPLTAVLVLGGTTADMGYLQADSPPPSPPPNSSAISATPSTPSTK